jgi:hypothetical protein
LEDADSSSTTALVDALRTATIQANEVAHAHRIALRSLSELYQSEVAQFNPVDWTKERLQELLPSLNNTYNMTSPSSSEGGEIVDISKLITLSKEDLEAEYARSEALKEREKVLKECERLHDECARRLEEFDRFGGRISFLRK